MKRASHLLCVLLLFTTAFAQQLTQADRDKGVAYLQQPEDGVAKAIKGLSEGQLKFKPAPDRWSVAETLEHIMLAEDYIFQNVTDKIMKAPAGAANRDSSAARVASACSPVRFPRASRAGVNRRKEANGSIHGR